MDIGVIGTGTMGSNHVRVYSELKDVDRVHVYDVNRAEADAVGAQFGCDVCGSVDELLDEVDAVSICAPTKHHYELAKRAIEHGVHCLVEKPVASSSEEGKKLLNLTRENLVVGVGHIERFNPIVGEIKKILTSPRYIEIRRHNPTSSRITDADVVGDLMIHDIDLVWSYFLNGEEYEICSFGDTELHTVVARFGGCVVSLSASRLACKKIRSIYIEEDEFSLDADFMSQEMYIYRRPQRYGSDEARYVQENVIEKVLVNKVEPLKQELSTFVGCVLTQEPFPITCEQAVRNLEIAEQIRGCHEPL